MLALQTLIKEGRPFSSSQVSQLIGYPHNAIFYRTYYRGLMSGSISPENSLIAILNTVSSADDIILVGLALRFKANPNLYIKLDDNNIHILAYVQTMFNDNPVFIKMRRTIIELLLLKGSLVSKPCYDVLAGRGSSLTNKTVKEYIHQQGFPDEVFADVTGSTKNHAILLDEVDLLNESLVARDVDFIVKCYASNVWATYPGSNTLYDPPGMIVAVQRYNNEAFLSICRRGSIPSYILMTTILQSLSSSVLSNHLIITDEIMEILINAVDNGAEVDNSQYSIIETMNRSDLRETFDKHYNQPYYKKICSSNRTMDAPVTLRKLYYSLGQDESASKQTICSNLEALDAMTKEEAEETLLKVNSKEMDKVSLTSELRGTSNSTLNKKVLDKPPDHVVSYRDSNDSIQAYTYETYDDILSSGVDNITERKLSDRIRTEMLQKRNHITKVGRELFMEPRDMRSISITESLQSLKNSDEPQSYDNVLYYFISILEDNGISKSGWNSLKKEQLRGALRTVGIEMTHEVSSVDLQRNIVATAYLSHLGKEKQAQLISILKIESSS